MQKNNCQTSKVSDSCCKILVCNYLINYKKIVADAGYESEEHYLFMEQNGQISFIKPSNYEISKTRKYKNDISRVENMEYIEKGDCYVCKLGRRLEVSEINHSKSKIGYVLPEISKPKNTKCHSRKYTVSNGAQHKQTTE